MKLSKLDRLFLFWCPGCDQPHPFDTTRWQFNGNTEQPTFSPSLLVHPHNGEPKQPRCHLFLRDGKLEFCSDSDHKLAGKTVDLPDWPYK